MPQLQTDIERFGDSRTEDDLEREHGRPETVVLSPSTNAPGGDSGGGGHGPPIGGTPPPSDAIVHYLGPNFITQAQSSGFYVVPPDNTSAAGDQAVVVAVNLEMQVWSRAAGAPDQLTKVFDTSLIKFFNSDGVFDPRVLYDPNSDRFIVVTGDTDFGAQTSHIDIAVSKVANPSSAADFSTVRLDVGGAIPGSWADFPQVGLDNAGHLYITANMFTFTGSFTGSRLWVVNEATLTSSAAIDPNGAAEDLFSLTPTNMPTGSGNFLLAYNSAHNAAGHNVIDVFTVNAAGAATSQQVDVGTIDLAPQYAGLGAPQAGTQRTIDAGDTRMEYAVWNNGHLYAVSNIVPDEGPDAGHVTAHFWAFNASTAGGPISVANQGDISGNSYSPGSDLRSYYPSVAVGSSGGHDLLAVGFAGSAPANGAGYVGYGSAYVATFDPLADTSGNGYQEIGDWDVQHSGVAPYFRAFGPQFDNRWGDYSSVTVDPLDAAHFWAFNQYADTPGSVLRGYGAEDGRWATDLGLFS